MNKKQVNSVKKVIEYTRNAIRNLGWYMPTDPQTEALKALYAAASYKLGKREASRFATYLMDIDNANLNRVYAVCATEKQIAAVEKALAAYLAE